MTSRAGFQASDTVNIDVTFYLDDRDDRVYQQYVSGLRKSGTSLRLNGRRNAAGENPSLLSLTTTKKIGPASGSCVMQVKAPRDFPDLRNAIPDDTWFDVVMTSRGKRFHLMRGMTRAVSKKTTGPSETFTITGEDFGRVFSLSSPWFNLFRVDQGVASPGEFVRQRLGVALATPAQVARSILIGMLGWNEKFAQVNWNLPRGMPGGAGQPFSDVVRFDASGFTGYPGRLMPYLGLMPSDGQSSWTQAQEFADPHFCEMIADLVPAAETPDAVIGNVLGLDGADIAGTRMGVIFRDRPFASLSGGVGVLQGEGSDAASTVGRSSPWFKLPTAEVDFREIEDEDTGRSGDERFNAFFYGPALLSSLGKSSTYLELVAPLWNERSIRDHGLRRFDVDSRYISAKETATGLASAMRERARDWHCLNHLFLNGSLSLGHVRPDIRIGHRVRVTGKTQPETFYVEEVTQQWAFGAATKTKLGVTRGWQGTDESYLAALAQESTLYGRISNDASAGGVLV